MSSEPSPVWTLRVTAVDRFAARAAVRRRQFTISRPLDFDPAHDGITALEYALGALAGDVAREEGAQPEADEDLEDGVERDRKRVGAFAGRTEDAQAQHSEGKVDGLVDQR